MNDLNQFLNVGTVLVIETGEYSDRQSCSPVRVIRRFKKSSVANNFKKEWKPDSEDYWRKGPSPHDFLPWLVAKGYVEAIDNTHDWHVGSYGEFEP